MSKLNDVSDSKIRKPRVDRGVWNWDVRLEVERHEYMVARDAARLTGETWDEDVCVASSGSYGSKPRQFRKWNAAKRRFETWYYDAMEEKWCMLDTRPKWEIDLEAVRERLRAKGKLPKGGFR